MWIRMSAQTIYTVEDSIPIYPNRYDVFCAKHDKNPGVDAPHRHDFVQMWYVKDGSYLHYWEGNEAVLGKGTLFIVPPYSAHFIDTRSNPEIFQCSFAEWWLGLEQALGELYFCGPQVFLRKGELPCYSFGLEAALKVEDILYELERIYHLHDPFYLPYARTTVLRLFAFLANGSNGWKDERFFSQLSDLFEAINYIHNNYMEKLYVKDISRLAMMSERSFSWIFKQITGVTFVEYLTYLRVLHARVLLTTTDRTQFDIGRSCGFFDAAHFQHIFKRMTGILPGDYRRSADRPHDNPFQKI